MKKTDISSFKFALLYITLEVVRERRTLAHLDQLLRGGRQTDSHRMADRLFWKEKTPDMNPSADDFGRLKADDG